MMKCMGFGLITEDVHRLRTFYTELLGCTAEGDDIHTEIHSEGLSFVIYDKAAALADMGISFAEIMGHGYTTISFEVDDVDAEYVRLKVLGIEFMTQPHTYPWGSRSVHFRDPDGNIVTLLHLSKQAN